MGGIQQDRVHVPGRLALLVFDAQELAVIDDLGWPLLLCGEQG